MSLKKTAPKESPHAIFESNNGDWQWRVLRAYKAPKGESKDPYARWFCGVLSPLNYGGISLGDTYAREVKQYGRLVSCSVEWSAAYGHMNTELQPEAYLELNK